MNQLKSQAQVSAGKLRDLMDEKIATARQQVSEQEERIREEARLAIDLPDPQATSTRRLLELHDPQGLAYLMRGPQRVALQGHNGIGKTLLLGKR